MKLIDNIIAFARKRSLKGCAKDPDLTGLEPLSSIGKVSVFFDADLPASAQLITYVSDYFNSRGKEVCVFAMLMGMQTLNEGLQKAVFFHKEDVNWFGRLKRGKRYHTTDVGEDMFISLLGEDTFAVEYAARCSSARFKVGRKQLSGNVYDLVVSDSGSEPADQRKVFDAIMEFVEKIKD